MKEKLWIDHRLLLKHGNSDEDIPYLCPHCDHELDFERLLRKYGPEGLYDIAKKLMKLADEDMSNALSQIHKEL